MKLRKILQIGAGLLIAGIIVGYSIYQAQDFWAGPAVVIQTPTDGSVVSEPTLVIKGRAERIARLSLNGRQIYTDAAGYFEEKLLLAPGYNIITVAATDAFERETAEHVRVILNASSSLLFSSYNYHGQAKAIEKDEGREE